MNKEPLRIRTLYPNHFCNHSATYACIALTSGMCRPNVDVSVMGVSCDGSFQWSHYTNGIPRMTAPLAKRLLSRDQLRKLTELRFYASLGKRDMAYLWPSTSLTLFKKIKEKGNKIIVENINCHQKTALKILQNEYSRLGLSIAGKLNDAAIASSTEDETAKLELCDYVFSPSENVTLSLLNAGVSADKILSSSYGLSEDDILPYSIREKQNGEPLTAVFLGRVGIRKGIHLLLDYWDKADINGLLKIYGGVEKSAEALIQPYLNHPKIEFSGFNKDLRSVYRDADFFIMPSLEEGSPLVTYHALGAGLPCIVSPMAGSGIVKEGISGRIIDPHDEESWIDAIRTMQNSELRASQSLAAWQSAEHFLWKNVGERRTALLLQKLFPDRNENMR